MCEDCGPFPQSPRPWQLGLISSHSTETMPVAYHRASESQSRLITIILRDSTNLYAPRGSHFPPYPSHITDRKNRNSFPRAIKTNANETPEFCWHVGSHNAVFRQSFLRGRQRREVARVFLSLYKTRPREE